MDEINTVGLSQLKSYGLTEYKFGTLLNIPCLINTRLDAFGHISFSVKFRHLISDLITAFAIIIASHTNHSS